ncbi:MAG: hypothetical protein ACJA0E_002220 [Bermanella sp.]|jgi:hypothetical protein
MKILILLTTAILLPFSAIAGDINASNLPGQAFSLLDIERKCVALREGTDSLSVSCKGDNLKPVARSCGGYINGGLENVKLSCGGALWILSTKCKIEMRGANKGEFNCEL